MQLAVVIVCLVMALSYVAWHIRKVFMTAYNPCQDCKGCPLNDPKRKNHTCDKKKQLKKFGGNKKKP